MRSQQYRIEFKDILDRTILPEGISSEERNERLLPLVKHMSEHMPSKLFRYRDCSELSIDAFDKDILFASTSDKFNDPYDCLFRFDKEGVRNSIMQGLSKENFYAIRDYLRFGNDFPYAIQSFYTKDFLDYAKNAIRDVDDDMIENSYELLCGIKKKLDENYDKITDETVNFVKRGVYIACFSETIHSVTMWSHYAKFHQGFALEYDLRTLQMRCMKCDKLKQCEKAVINNLYPVIYDKRRYDATNYLLSFIGKSLGLPMNNPDILAVSKCQLYKSTQWSYEKEWRLILTLMNGSPEEDFYGIKHIRPNAIYYGKNISPINKKILHLIAKEKGINEYQMFIDDKSYQYSIKGKKI